MIIEEWLHDYNVQRHPTHPAERELTPTEFALPWTMTHQPESRGD